MTDYIPPEPAVAERMYKQRLADKALNQRLREASTEQLKQMVRDANAPAEVRIPALSMLVDHGRLPVDDELADTLLGFLADPDRETRRMALHPQGEACLFPLGDFPRR